MSGREVGTDTRDLELTEEEWEEIFYAVLRYRGADCQTLGKLGSDGAAAYQKGTQGAIPMTPGRRVGSD